jgi:hypothetical protein
LVVKNGSNAWAATSGGMPVPVSFTATRHVRARRDVGMQRRVAPIERGVRHLDGHRSALGHGVARIDRQVEDGVLELAGVDLGVPRLGGDVELDGDALAERMAQQVGQVAHQAGDIGRLRRQRLARAKARSCWVSLAPGRPPRRRR